MKLLREPRWSGSIAAEQGRVVPSTGSARCGSDARVSGVESASPGCVLGEGSGSLGPKGAFFLDKNLICFTFSAREAGTEQKLLCSSPTPEQFSLQRQ